MPTAMSGFHIHAHIWSHVHACMHACTHMDPHTYKNMHACHTHMKLGKEWKGDAKNSIPVASPNFNPLNSRLMVCMTRKKILNQSGRTVTSHLQVPGS